eukprot:CAMPEP_0185725920 /NCGR_PEP_ID=MMETSP1171-20130828/2047_1 /TAXON_ID=374046 /ORGANISM="Helicotheca tamensis, Strain CCMP826" /LENGTH=232 /DNA_ID=CAMNT_0028394163 /DNA_START=76 /DNA_END=774 /DNA_ORIENTATION=-
MPRTGILWSSISRDDVMLVEAGEDDGKGNVIAHAQKLVKKKPTPGWEFSSSRKSGLKGVKFHVYDIGGDLGDDPEQKIIWSFACVYEKKLEEMIAKSFLEKIVFITEPMRTDSYVWRHGTLLAAQPTFAPTLLQRMDQVSWQGRLSMVNKNIDETKEIMGKNIEMMLENQETLDEMKERSKMLEEMSKTFKKNTKAVRRYKMWQNAKHGLMVGTAVTGATALIVVPPLIALL